MASINGNYVRCTIQTVSTSNPSRIMAEEGDTYRDVISEQITSNPNKFRVTVNGNEVDIDDPVQDGDNIVLSPLNYKSGR